MDIARPSRLIHARGSSEAVRHPPRRSQLVAVEASVRRAVAAFEQIRDQVGEIGFIGLWWDQPPPEGPAAAPEEAFRSDPDAFRRLRIRNS